MLTSNRSSGMREGLFSSMNSATVTVLVQHINKDHRKTAITLNAHMHFELGYFYKLRDTAEQQV